MQSNMEKLQKAQNKLVRTLENVRIKDKNRTSEMLTKNSMLSVNLVLKRINVYYYYYVLIVDNIVFHKYALFI